jgi:hypothetical protein
MGGVCRRTRSQGVTNKVSMTASKAKVLGLLIAVDCRRSGAWLQGLGRT